MHYLLFSIAVILVFISSYYLIQISKGKEYLGPNNKPLPWWFFGTLLFVGLVISITGRLVLF